MPWLIAPRRGALTTSLILSGVAALGIGGTLGYLANGRVVHSALRQLLVVALAAAVTFLIGDLLGVAVS